MKNNLIKLASALALGVSASAASAASLTLTDFNDLKGNPGATFVTGGSYDKIVLTTGNNSQSGYAFSALQTGVTDFTANFDIWLGNKDSGADGIVFGFFDSNIPGTKQGGSMGYSQDLRGFGVEFDTYYNNGQDPVNSDHIAVVTPNPSAHGSVHLAHQATDNLEVGIWLSVAVAKLGNDLSVSLNNAAEGISESLSYSFLSSTLTDGYFGFMAATGGANNLQKVRGVSLETTIGSVSGGNGDIPAVPVPAAVWLFGTAILGFAGFRRRASLAS